MTEALLFVLSEPGRVDESEFHRWYDEDHGPARLAIPGIRGGWRYRALDDATPTWLAWYDTDLATLSGPAYRALREHRGDREQALIESLGALDRRVYRLISDHGQAQPDPAPVVVCTSMSTPDPAALDTWYAEEHIPMLHAIPGWWRTRRYQRVTGEAPEFLAFHEIAGSELFRTDDYRRAISTPWRDQVIISARERRVFGYHNTVTGPPGNE
jgi:hypothetical protein